MTEPSRTSTDRTHGADTGGDLDPTLARPAGEDVVLSPLGRKIEAQFGPPENAGEVGTLGRYRVLKKLGQGGMGAVYLGHDVTLGRPVALKVMRPEHAADPESRARFLREARAVAMVRSDHVVTIFDVGEDDRGVAFIAMEHLRGAPLDRYIHAKGELPLAHVFRVGRETALGLAAAHDLGLIHRDIKPGNIWLEAPKGRVKILDFGLARVQTDDTHLTTTGIVVGTPAFMSPEQARGLKLDGRSDLFSLGVVLFRLATGKMPFEGTTTMALLTSLAVDAPPPARQVRPDVPRALEAVINKLLAKNPDDRYTTAWEAAAALRAAELAPSSAGEAPTVPTGPGPVAPQPAQNPWEELDESSSTAQVLDSDTGAATVLAPSERRPIPRRAPKLNWILAGAALLLVCVVAALVANMLFLGPMGTLLIAYENADTELRIERNGEVVRERTRDREIRLEPGQYTVRLVESGFQVEPDTFTITENGKTYLTVRPARPPEVKFQVAFGTDLDRRAAEYALSVKGIVRTNDSVSNTSTRDGLPREPFALTMLSLANTAVTDNELSVVQGCKNIKILNLNDCVRITDAGLVHFAESKGLSVVELQNTAITDAGLEYLKTHKNLLQLKLKGTKVTAKGVAVLARELPKCQIEWDGGTAGPKK